MLTQNRWFLLCVLPAFLLCGSGGETVSAQERERYELVVPGRPDLTSTATVAGDRLVITDPAGVNYRYERRPRQDSADGAYLAWYCEDARQFVRFPTRGRGSMFISDASARNWRRSRQRVVPFGQAGLGHAHGPAAPWGFTVYPDAGRYWLLHIDQEGNLVVFNGTGERWVRDRDYRASGLVPGGQVAVLRDPAGRGLLVLTVDHAGRLVDARHPEIEYAPSVRLQPGGYLVVGHDQEHETHIFAVNADGDLVRMDVFSGELVVMGIPGVHWFPGQPLVAVPARETVPGHAHSVVLVDRGGRVVEVSSLGRDWRADAIAGGFVPGSPLDAATLGDDGLTPCIAGVDAAGTLRMLIRNLGGWSAIQGPPGRYAPGGPLALGGGPVRPTVSLVTPAGEWLLWEPVPDNWVRTLVQPGFGPGSPVDVAPGLGYLFTLDQAGDFAVGYYYDSTWHSYLCRPGFDRAPRLVERRVVPHDPLPPATVTLENSSDEPLFVQAVDDFDPRRPAQVEIPPRDAVQQVFERDAGATVQETYLVPGPMFGTWVERVEEYPLPPRPRYSLVVWAQRVTYQYIDERENRPAGALQSFDLRSNVSLGVIPIPAGDLLLDGEHLDVPAEAAYYQNPGTAAPTTQPR